MNKLRKVLITGANRGLGFKLAETLSPKQSILLTSRDINKANEAKKIILDKIPQSQIITQSLDVGSPESIKQFKQWMSEEKQQIDVLVNNAGVNDDMKCDRVAYTIFNINLFGQIDLTESLLPQLSDDAKIIFISSMLGKLKLQPTPIKNKLNNLLTKSDIIGLANELIQVHEATGKFGQWSPHIQPLYKASKALVNAYVRHVLSKQIKLNQSAYLVHPGWVRTDMGGQQAPAPVEDGVITSRFLIEDVSYGRDEKLNGKYFNEKCQVEEEY